MSILNMTIVSFCFYGNHHCFHSNGHHLKIILLLLKDCFIAKSRPTCCSWYVTIFSEVLFNLLCCHGNHDDISNKTRKRALVTLNLTYIQVGGRMWIEIFDNWKAWAPKIISLSITVHSNCIATFVLEVMSKFSLLLSKFTFLSNQFQSTCQINWKCISNWYV